MRLASSTFLSPATATGAYAADLCSHAELPGAVVAYYGMSSDQCFYDIDGPPDDIGQQ